MKLRVFALLAAACFALGAIFTPPPPILPNIPEKPAENPPETPKIADFNGNGISDTADLLAGAKQDAANKPTYDSAYVVGGYPDDSRGVCTDVVWRAFRQAGFSLRDMVDTDIRARPDAYTAVSTPDSNIDFRRVRNLRVFFDAYCHKLPNNTDFEAGDILIFNSERHIGIVSDIKNERGTPYIIHNGGQANREEDYLSKTRVKVVAHYRFDADLLPERLKIAWE